MTPKAVVVFLTLVLVMCEVAADRKLAYVTVLFRHGDRSAIKAYPTDKYQESAWPQGFGQLSQVHFNNIEPTILEGMKQHFELGQFLRKRYQGFLNETYDRHEISVRSTDYDRTLMSVEANLAGLYPPSGRQVFNPDLKWQPIPVHTVPLDQERLLSFPRRDCPRYAQLMNETERTPEFLNVTKKYQDFIEMVKNKTGLKHTNVESVWSVYDTLFCESRHNLSAPDWVTTDVMDKLKILKDFAFQVMFGVYKGQEKNRLQGGLLLGEIIKNLSKMAAPDPNKRLKIMMLSAHDTTVAALQASLSVFNGKQPPYASCQIIELHRGDNGSVTVSMFYRNDTGVPPYPLALPGCTADCPLEDFVRITKPFIPDDWDKECQVPSGDKEVIVGLAVSGCMLLLLIVLLLILLCRQKQPINSRGYLQVTNQEAGEEYHS